jgi:hypothetical protein
MEAGEIDEETGILWQNMRKSACIPGKPML